VTYQFRPFGPVIGALPPDDATAGRENVAHPVGPGPPGQHHDEQLGRRLDRHRHRQCAAGLPADVLHHRPERKEPATGQRPGDGAVTRASCQENPCGVLGRVVVVLTAWAHPRGLHIQEIR
jgi:hypothetical protein